MFDVINIIQLRPDLMHSAGHHQAMQNSGSNLVLCLIVSTLLVCILHRKLFLCWVCKIVFVSNGKSNNGVSRARKDTHSIKYIFT